MKGFKTEMYFGTHVKDGEQVTEGQFNSFLTEIVDPMLANYTISKTTGKYTYKDGTPIEEPTYVLTILSPIEENTTVLAMKVALIANEYTTRFNQESVLLCSGQVVYDFLES